MITHKTIESMQPTGKRERLMVDEGLTLIMSAKGKKSWQVRFQANGANVNKTIGRYPAISLAEARARLQDYRGAAHSGQDVEEFMSGRSDDTFKNHYLKWCEFKTTGSKPLSPAYAKQMMRRFERYVLPMIGDKYIGSIKSGDILRIVEDIQRNGHYETARRVKDQMSQIFDYAKFEGEWPNPVEGINARLPPRSAKKPQPYLKPDDMVEFFRRLSRETGLQRQTRVMLELTIRTMVRTNEIRFGQWSELQGDLWEISAERMKMERPHAVPLVPQTKALFDQLREICNDPREWGAHRGTNLRPKGDDMCAISENGMLFALYRMGYKGVATVHGFRATASTFLYASEKFRDRAIEMSLAHVEKNAVKGAYNHHDYLPERRRLMKYWNDWLDVQKATGELL